MANCDANGQPPGRHVHAPVSLLATVQKQIVPAQAAFDDLVIYDRPLTAEQAAKAFAGTLPRTLASKRQRRTEPESSERPAKLIFHLPLDGNSKALAAGGAAQPLQEQGLTYETGLFGQAARFSKGTSLRFATRGNLTKEQGSILLWFRPDWNGSQTQNERGGYLYRRLFLEGPAAKERIDSSQLMLWFHGAQCRFDVSDYADQYVQQSVSSWRAGDWHHLAATWDHRRGRELYVDGQRVTGSSHRHKPFMSMGWSVVPFEYFEIGGESRRRSADGLIDELRIYDNALNPEEIAREFARVYPVCPVAPHRYYALHGASSLRWRLDSNVSAPVRGTLQWRVDTPDGQTVIPTRQEAISLATGKASRHFELSWTPAAAGRHVLVCRWQPQGQGPTYERRLDLWAVDAQRTLTGSEKMDLQLIQEIDCAADLPADQLAQSAGTRVVQSGLGTYREAAAPRNSRFALRVRLPDNSGPYVVEWEYPDDKPRTMELIAQSVNVTNSEYELQTGVFTGAEYALSHTMKTHRCLYWPRSADVALIFMTAEKDRPAAAGKVRVLRVRGQLPREAVSRPAPVDGWQRHVGIYYEDPALCYDFGNQDSMPDFEILADRLLAYMHYSGQDLLMYPGVWYHGPFYPSDSQGLAVQRAHPFNFIEYLLLRFESGAFGFLPTLNVHSLPSLADYKWHDDMLLTGQAAAGPLSVGWDGNPNFGGWHGTRPNYNILHPRVRAAVLTMIDELLDLYGDSPAFKGVGFHLTRHCLLWLGDIEGGYNDYCVEAFQRDTGIRVPVAGDDPGRTPKRYQWLMANARQQWIDWRCRALRAFYGEVAERLAAKRPDLRLVLTMYRPVFRDVVDDPSVLQTEDFIRQINRQGGLDPDLYADLPNVVLDRTIYPADYRWYRSHRKWTEDPRAIRNLMLDAGTYGSWTAGGKAWVNMHDRYWEDAIGRKGWPSFWGREQGWRVSTLNATPPYAMESYLVPLTHADIMTFTKGGFLIGTHGMERELTEFSRAFRALPARPFALVEGVSAPLVARVLSGAAETYFYVLNSSQEPATLSLTFTGKVEAVHDLRTGKTVRWTGGLSLKMPPMSFRAYRAAGRNIVVRASKARQ